MSGCGWCGGLLVQPATGRRRLFCCDAHRVYAWRARNPGAADHRGRGRAIDETAAARGSARSYVTSLRLDRPRERLRNPRASRARPGI